MSKNKLVKVTVTKQDIKNGNKSSPWSCAISLAALRVFNDFQHTGTQRMFFGCAVESFKYVELPRSAQRFIKVFDACKKNAKPFTFQVRVPGKLIK